jgi:predicted dehydrogenase
MGRTVGLVGCGRWGANHLRTLNALKSTGHIHRIAVCDIDPKKLESVQADETYGSLGEMLEAEPLDAVAIVTPPSTHVKLAQQARENNLPLLVEKPLSECHETTQEFLETLGPNTVMVVGYILRHHHAIQHLLSPNIADALGGFTSVNYVRQTVRQRPEHAEPITTLGVHALDLIAWLLNESLEVSTTTLQNVGRNDARVHLTFPSGKGGMFDVAWNAENEERRLHIRATGGEVSVDFGSGEITLTVQGERTVLQSSGHEPLLAEWMYFLNRLDVGEEHIFPSIDRLIDQSQWLAKHGSVNSL